MVLCFSANNFSDMTIFTLSHSLALYPQIIPQRTFKDQPTKWLFLPPRRSAFCWKMMSSRNKFGCPKLVYGSPVLKFMLKGNRPCRRIRVSSMNGIDCEGLSEFQIFQIGPLPGDMAEIEAFCRIFRAAEQLHSEIMNTLCDPVTGECAVTYAESQNGVSGDVAILQEKVVAALACMATLLQRGREEVLSGRLVKAHSLHIAERNDDKLPPLAIFREEMKDCCCKLQSAIQSYFMPSDKRTISIWTSLQRLKNLSYDAGFPRSNGSPCHAVLPNWSPVSLFPIKSGTVSNDSEVAFWRGGQVTEEGLKWLIKKGYKTIVDLRAESIEDPWSVAAVEEAVHLGKIQLVHIPVKIGNAPTGEQVEEFTKLIQNFEGMPLYLHSQEGILRTSAMVSRWRESALRNKSSSLSSNMHNTDQILQSSLQNDEKGSNGMYHTRSLEFQQSEGEDDSQISGMENGSLFKVHMKNESNVQSDSIFHHNVFTLVDDVENSVNDKKLEEGNDGVKRKISPFEAQRPRCDILSRREMSAMFKNGKISPTTFFACDDKRTKRSCQSFVDEHSNNNNNLPSSAVRKSASEENNQKLEICRTAMPMGKNNGSKTLFENRNSMLPIDPSSHGNDIIDPLEGDLSVSTTGVVRVQSRKKAEMYLVRTDGFSCTRERVKESLLAFTHPSTQQQMLMWKTPPKTVLLLKKLGEELVEEAKQVASYLYYKERMNVVVEPEVHDMFSRVPGFSFIQTFYNHDINDLHERVDFVACLGGDGVILHASNLFREAVPPVVSFNLGSLGFLTAHHFTDYEKDLSAIIHGNSRVGVYITLRMRLRCQIFRNEKALPGKLFDVLNDVVVDRGSSPYLCKIECYERNCLITKVQADGVIVATPTGSTAYSTSAGGSVVHPNVPCMLFTPICPHSLSFRPVILPDSAQLILKIPEDARSNAWISFDGKKRQQLLKEDSVHVCMSEHPLPTVNKSDQTGDWFRSLVRCLNWNDRLEQKSFI